MATSESRRNVWRWPAAIVAIGALAAGACWAVTTLTPSHAGDTLLVLDTQIPDGKIGLVRRADLLVAYHKSQRFSDWMDHLRDQRDEARSHANVALADAYEAFGAELQEVAHRQLAGREPLYTLVVGAQDDLRAVMEARGVCWLREAGPGVTGIDITQDIVRALEAHDRPGAGAAPPPTTGDQGRDAPDPNP